ncbi:MAG: GntP family permease [Chitinophagaceae bacterium]
MYYEMSMLLVSIVFMIWSTAVKKINAFFVLLFVSIFFGTVCGIDQIQIITVLKSGFGKTMEKIGILIIFGTALGIILERTGATVSMANTIIRLVKEKHAPIAIALTGFVVGLPIFCDSAFIILSGLNNSLINRSGKGKLMMVSILAFSLLVVHCFIPPHPGITAAASTLGLDLGLLMVWGICISVPVILAGYAWASWNKLSKGEDATPEQLFTEQIIQMPSAYRSFIPVILPIVLIAAKSILFLPVVGVVKNSGIWRFFNIVGDPVYALGIGIIASFFLIKKDTIAHLNDWVSDALLKAGLILSVTAGGGIFGEMIQVTGVGKALGDWMGNNASGIFLPFILSAILKSAQGSSTVAVITTASIVAPIMATMGIHTNTEILLYVLSMGAGSMVFSHANDSYFWVICKFSNIEPNSALKMYSTGTALMGIFAQIIIWGVFQVVR